MRGIGSAFDESRRFRSDSDIDLVVESLPPDRYFGTLLVVSRMTDFEIDLIPLESADACIRRLVDETGVVL